MVGYNLYRDGAPVNQTILAQPTFTDNAVADGDHTYHVTAVYNRGESALSAPATVKISGIADIFAGGKTFDVYTVEGIVLLRDASAADIRKLARGIYIIDGKKVRL